MRARRALVVSLIFALGCDRPANEPAPEPDGAADVTPAPGLVLPDYEVTSPGEAAGGPTITVTSRFLSVPRGALDAMLESGPGGDSAAAGVALVDRDSIETLDARTDAGEFVRLAAPTISVFAGQRSNVVVVEQSAYIQDFELIVSPGGEPGVVDPVIGTLSTGCIVDLEASVAKGAVVFSRLDPQLALKLGTRTCTITVPGLAERVPCEEPVLLSASARHRDLRVPDGSTVLLKLAARVQQHTCQARMLGGPFEESYAAASRSWGDGPRDFFLRLEVSVASENRDG